MEIDNATISGLADAIAQQALAEHTCVAPTPPEVRDTEGLQGAVNAVLPEGFAVTVVRSDSETLTLIPSGFTIDPEDRFVAPSLTVERVSFTADCSGVKVPDVYISGYTLEQTIEESTDTDLAEHIDANNYSGSVHVGRPRVTSVEDVYVEVEVEFTVEGDLSPTDLTLGGATLEGATFDSEDEREEAVREALTDWLCEAYGMYGRDIDDLDVTIS